MSFLLCFLLFFRLFFVCNFYRFQFISYNIQELDWYVYKFIPVTRNIPDFFFSDTIFIYKYRKLIFTICTIPSEILRYDKIFSVSTVFFLSSVAVIDRCYGFDIHG
jgi:hypothetical protein